MKNPFTYEKLTLNKTEVHLVSYVDFNPLDYLDYLTGDETERILTFKSHSRKKEFAATRILRHKIIGFEHIHYDINGAPYIKNAGFISISHGKHLVGIAINKLYAIGFDLESQRSNILDLKSKFLSESEKKEFNINDPLEVTKMWSAKEALYKLAGRKKIHFKSELLLSKLTDTEWNGRILNPDHDLLVKLNIFEHNETIISINTEEIVKQYRNT